MYCSQCGKKVTDSMLFCPFCGSAIVIPEQDEKKNAPEVADKAVNPAQNPAEAEDSSEKSVLDGFIPLDVNLEWDKVDIPAAPEADFGKFPQLDFEFEAQNPVGYGGEARINDEISDLLGSQIREEPVRLGGHVPDLSNVGGSGKNRPKSGGKSATYAPMKAFNPNDIFLDGEDEEDYEDYEDEEYDYEEREEGGFLIRHIRGLVAFSLCIVVLAILAGWAFSDAGQFALANANLAWRPGVYERLGYEAYQAGKYTTSGNHYAKALSLDEDKYDYAYSAGVAYYTAKDTARATEMAKKTIAIDAGNPDGYYLLLRLYPSADTRPWEITELIRQGYQMTGEAALNVFDGEK